MNKSRGFTLIEILIAIFIFAIISMIATTVLSSIFNARQHTDSRMQQLDNIQLATILIQRDLTQMVARPIREANSDIIPAFVAKPSYIEFTRTGNPNPFGTLQQSNLLRVAYEIKNGNLLRLTWPRLDRVSGTEADSRIVLSNIISGHFTFLGEKSTFFNTWPPGNLLNNTNVIPRAIAINLKLKNWGDYYLLVPIPSTAL